MTRFDAVAHFDQPGRGYRFSADSIWLAEFVAAEGGLRAADFGAGCGVAGLVALEKGRLRGLECLFFLEREPLFQPHLDHNLRLYQPRTAVQLSSLIKDWREARPEDFGGPLDYVMVNPPYFNAKASRPSPEPTRDAARRELFGGLADLCASLTRLLTPSTGRAALVLPEARRAELDQALAKAGLAVVRASSRPRLMLIEAGFGQSSI